MLNGWKEFVMNRAVRASFLAAGLAFAFAAAIPAQTVAPLRIAFVRPDYVLSQYQPYIDAVKVVQDFEKAENDKIGRAVAQLQSAYDEAQKQAPLMTEDKRNQKVQELEKQRTDIQQAQDDLMNQDTGTLYKKHEEVMKPIFDRLNGVLERVGQNEKYDFIFNVTADTQSILYADKKYDISDHVYQELLKEPTTNNPAKPTTTPGTKPPVLLPPLK
jgi:outer membrane protein